MFYQLHVDSWGLELYNGQEFVHLCIQVKKNANISFILVSKYVQKYRKVKKNRYFRFDYFNASHEILPNSEHSFELQCIVIYVYLQG